MLDDGQGRGWKRFLEVTSEVDLGRSLPGAKGPGMLEQHEGK